MTLYQMYRMNIIFFFFIEIFVNVSEMFKIYAE